jgi:hypothetical protein
VPSFLENVNLIRQFVINNVINCLLDVPYRYDLILSSCNNEPLNYGILYLSFDFGDVDTWINY